MPSAQTYAGITKGLNQLSKDYSESDLRKARLGEAQAKQKTAEATLSEYNANAGNRKRTSDAELTKLENQAKASNAQSLRDITISAMDRFDADGDVRHLNTWNTDAKKNPMGSKIYGPVARYDKLVKTNENDQMLRQAGLDPDIVYEKTPDAYLVVTQNDGSQSLLPKETMYAATQYNNYQTNEKLAENEKQARINQMNRAGMSSSDINMRESVMESLIKSGKAKNISEAYSMLLKMEETGKGQGVLSSTEERAVATIMEEKNVGYLEGLDMYMKTKRQGTGVTNEGQYVEEFMADNEGATYEEAVSSYKNLAKTSTQKEVVDVKQLRTGLDEMGWLDTNISEMTGSEKSRVYRDYISPIEDLRNFKFTSEEKREMRNFRNLTQLGDTVSEQLTSEQTGLIDSTLNKFKSYIFDEVGGKEATSSYETLRNLFRHALFSSTVTKGETQSFEKAAGNLGQRFKPVMQQLQVQMETVKNNLESIRDLNDPDIAHYYTGESIEEIDQVIENIENRLNSPSWKTASEGPDFSSMTKEQKEDYGIAKYYKEKEVQDAADIVAKEQRLKDNKAAIVNRAKRKRGSTAAAPDKPVQPVVPSVNNDGVDPDFDWDEAYKRTHGL